MMMSRARPTASAAIKPKMRSAAAFHSRITPSRSAKISASGACSMRNEMSRGVVLVFKASAPDRRSERCAAFQHTSHVDCGWLPASIFGEALEDDFKQLKDHRVSRGRRKRLAPKMVHLYLSPLPSRPYARTTTREAS